MIPLGKTYLVKCIIDDSIAKEDNIFVLNDINILKDTFWKGEIFDYGAGWSEEEKSKLLPKGTKIVMSYGKTTSDKGGTKLVFGRNVFYIRKFDEVLGVIDDE